MKLYRSAMACLSADMAKQGKLRLSLDRVDFWDERKALDISTFNLNGLKSRC